MSHKTEIQAIKRYVELLGGTCNVLHQVGRLCGTAGIPDLYIQLTRYGAAFWMEVKVGRDKLRTAQDAFIEREGECGRAVVVGDLDALMANVESLFGDDQHGCLCKECR